MGYNGFNAYNAFSNGGNSFDSSRINIVNNSKTFEGMESNNIDDKISKETAPIETIMNNLNTTNIPSFYEEPKRIESVPVEPVLDSDKINDLSKFGIGINNTEDNKEEAVPSNIFQDNNQISNIEDKPSKEPETANQSEDRKDYLERLNALIESYTDYKSLLKTFGKNDIKEVLDEAREKQIINDFDNSIGKNDDNKPMAI